MTAPRRPDVFNLLNTSQPLVKANVTSMTECLASAPCGSKRREACSSGFVILGRGVSQAGDKPRLERIDFVKFVQVWLLTWMEDDIMRDRVTEERSGKHVRRMMRLQGHA
jgi:hypothetical protein